MDIMSWYQRTVGDDSENAVAKRAEVYQGTLNRQLKAASLSPETVVAIARAYGVDPLDALVSQGLLTLDDVEYHAIRKALCDATDEDIAREVWARLCDGPRPVLAEPIAPNFIALAADQQNEPLDYDRDDRDDH